MAKRTPKRYVLLDCWDCSEGSRILGVRETGFSEAYRPAMLKVAKMMLADPLRTMGDLMLAMDDLRQIGFERQLPELESRLEGRSQSR